MIAQSKAELLKIRSTRTALGLVLGMIALVVLTTLLTGLLTKAGSLSTREDQRTLLAAGSPWCTGAEAAVAACQRAAAAHAGSGRSPQGPGRCEGHDGPPAYPPTSLIRA